MRRSLIIVNMEHEVLWNAVTNRDERFDGAFVFAVATTGVFCRPSCKARRPNRVNVRFFNETVEAVACGYRACLRCKPLNIDHVDEVVQKVIAACEMLADMPEATLEEVASTAGMSAYHFQRKFKDIVGVSPKKYAEAIKMERFRDEIRGGRDVTDAMYEAGYGSSRGLYEKASANLGMTPATYKKGGVGMKIEYTIVDCSLGKMLVARTDRGICSVTFGDEPSELASALRDEFPNAEIAEDAENLGKAVKAILEYLSGKQHRIVLPLDLQATAFQLQVWELLRKIPYGETRSYSQIAEQMGDKKKVRAVARACATNRIALVIPCHRVVAADGGLAGYRWGVERKEILLANEKAA